MLLSEVSPSKSDEIRFDIYGFLLKFSVGEFALVTGLKCTNDFERKKIEKSVKNNLVDKYVYGSSKVKKSDIEDCFLSIEFDCDKDALKLAVLYFVNFFLFFAPKNKFVNKDYSASVNASIPRCPLFEKSNPFPGLDLRYLRIQKTSSRCIVLGLCIN